MRTLIIIHFFLSTSAFGQTTSGDTDFPRIFGEGKDYNGTILVTADNYSIKYSRDDCNIKCVNSKGQEKWTSDLSKLSCELIYFALIPKTKIKKCDIYFQLKDKRIFLLKSRTGKTIFMTAEECDKYGSKKNK